MGRRWVPWRWLAKRWLQRRGGAWDVTWHGFRLRLYPAQNAGDMGLMLTGRHGEEDEIAIVQDEAPRHDVFVDVGANIGLYSLTAARAMPAGARVLAFEADPVVAERLRRHLAFNRVQAVTVVEAALGAAPGTAVLHRNPANLGGNSLVRTGSGRIDVTVPVMTLAQALADRGVDHVGMLKIDIEGYEDRVLVAFLASAPPALWPAYVLIEVCHRAHWEEDAEAALGSRGYVEVYRNRRNRHFRRGLA
jgi:FkbM family methyltransferase